MPTTAGGARDWRWPGTGGALEDLDAAAQALADARDVLRQTYPDRWASTTADEFTEALGTVLASTYRLDAALEDARAAAATAAARAAAATAAEQAEEAS